MLPNCGRSVEIESGTHPWPGRPARLGRKRKLPPPWAPRRRSRPRLRASNRLRQQHSCLRVQHGQPNPDTCVVEISPGRIFAQQPIVGTGAPAGRWPKVHHHRDIGQSFRPSTASIHGYPFRPRVVGCLDAHNKGLDIFWPWFARRPGSPSPQTFCSYEGPRHARTHNIPGMPVTPRFRAVQ